MSARGPACLALLALVVGCALGAATGCRRRRPPVVPGYAAQLDWASPTQGTIALAAGFRPEPQGIVGTTGGDIFGPSIAAGCRGFFPSAPQHVMRLESSFSLLRITVRSRANTTLMVRAPGGDLFCDDDHGGGRDPSVLRRYLPAGDYAVFVGSHTPPGRAPPHPYAIYFATAP